MQLLIDRSTRRSLSRQPSMACDPPIGVRDHTKSALLSRRVTLRRPIQREFTTRRLRLAFTGVAVIAGLVAPGTALAAKQYHNIGSSVSDRGSWTYERDSAGNVPIRTVTDGGAIWLKPDILPGGGLAVRLVNVATGRVFGNIGRWSDAQWCHRKLLGDNLPAGFRFKVQAARNGAGNDNYWEGWTPPHYPGPCDGWLWY